MPERIRISGNAGEIFRLNNEAGEYAGFRFGSVFLHEAARTLLNKWRKGYRKMRLSPEINQ